jgi:hypothetical protein
MFDQPEKSFSWWDYRMLGYQKNRGLRIDHILVSQPLVPRVKGCVIDRVPRKWEKPSDHAPVVLDLEQGRLSRWPRPFAHPQAGWRRLALLVPRSRCPPVSARCKPGGQGDGQRPAPRRHIAHRRSRTPGSRDVPTVRLITAQTPAVRAYRKIGARHIYNKYAEPHLQGQDSAAGVCGGGGRDRHRRQRQGDERGPSAARPATRRKCRR